jgi:hypothetical protein
VDALQHKIGLIKRDRSTTIILLVGLFMFNGYTWNNIAFEQATVSTTLFIAGLFWVKYQSRRLNELESLKYAGGKYP